MELAVGGHDRGADRVRWPEVAAGAAVSIALHGGLALAVVLATVFSGSEPAETYHLVFDDVELLALGEIRDSRELPRMAGDMSPPEADQVVIDPTVEEPDPQPTAEAPPEPDPAAIQRQREEEEARREEEERRAREERQRRREAALGRIDSQGPGDAVPEGSQLGVAGGTVSDEALANMMQTYQVRVLQEIQRFWEVPSTLSEQELQSLYGMVRVHVRLSDSGHVTSYQFLSRSGNDQFDQSIERVIQRFERQRGGRALPMPDQPELRRQVVSQGLTLTNWELIHQ
jgi:TonB family protein